jgi:uncharacterized protein YhhL (DUF1145 family)
MGRPDRLVRLMFLVFALIAASGLVTDSPRPLDTVKTVMLCGFMLFFAIAPRAIYDGRLSAWERKHPVQAAVLIFLFGCLLTFNALTYFLSPLTSAMIATGFSAAFALWVSWRDRDESDRPAE